MSDMRGADTVTDSKEAFEMFDGNGDGYIDPSDLKLALSTLGYEFNQDEILRFVMELDPQNTGKISYPEFSNLIREKMAEKDHYEDIQIAFQTLDVSKTGKITFSDLKKVAKDLGENITDHEIHEMINEADLDNDGEISFEEFMALVRIASPSI